MRTVVCALGLLLMTSPVFAEESQPADPMMQAAIESFKKIDKNNDNELTQQEFLEALPSMRPEAFTAIDTDRNEKISRKEWQSFTISHSSSRQGGGMMSMPPKDATPAPSQGGLPAILPPKN